MKSIQTLLHQIVDYAGLFPPAGLPLDKVISNYSEYISGVNRWMLGRLIVPASRLREFAEEFNKLVNEPPKEAWKISALIPALNAPDSGFTKAMESIEQFNSNYSYAQVDTIEGKLPELELIESTCQRIPDSIAAFLEISWSQPDSLIAELAAVGRPNTFAKIRTGGVTEDLIPGTDHVANFISACARCQLGFKATAGLHHPLRGPFNLTYEENSPTGVMHGFMNVFVAALFATCSKDPSSQGHLDEILNAPLTDFVLADDSISFRDRKLSLNHIKESRESFAISFGSCSFTEPLADLTTIGWLAKPAKTV